MPWLRWESPAWRGQVISECDYAFDLARIKLAVPVPEARLYMVHDGRFKYIHADGFAPMPHDLAADPQELRDLGLDPGHAEVRARLYEALARRSRMTRTRTTLSDAAITAADKAALAYDLNLHAGILIGYWDEAELAVERAKMAAWRAAQG